MDIHKFRKKLKRYQEGKTNETENALIDAWYRSYTGDELQISDDEALRTQAAAREKISSATSQAKIYRFPFFGVAASIIVLACATIAVLKFRHNQPMPAKYYTVSTGVNTVRQLTLPDGTTIWLNSASSIKIPENFEGNIRQLTLVEGEAFFDVHHDAHRPFIVQTSTFNVQVLGTSFNLRSFKSMKDAHVGVATGKVGITRNGKTLAMLTPGNELVLSKADGAFKMQRVNIGQLQSWKTGTIYLTNASFDELALVMKNNYAVSLKAANKKTEDYRFTLILQHGRPLNEALKLITQIHNTHFKKEGNEVMIY